MGEVVKAERKPKAVINTRKYIEEFIEIVDKSQNVVPFKLNKAQEMIYNVIAEEYKKGKGVKIIILKARQIGSTTLGAGILLSRTATKNNVSSSIIAQDGDATRDILKKVKFMHESLPEYIRPTLKASNANEIVFNDEAISKNSQIQVHTAGSPDAIRSRTIHNGLLTEVAFWDKAEENITALTSAIPDKKNSLLMVESTPNGNNYFKTMWDKAKSGENDYRPIFIAWYHHEEYRREADFTYYDLDEEEKVLYKDYELSLDQLAWRRDKIKALNGSVSAFRQEYPSNDIECFLSSQDTIFNKNKLLDEMKYLSLNRRNDKRGYFKYSKEIVDLYNYNISNIKWVDDIEGFITLHEAPDTTIKVEGKLQTRQAYNMGADTAGLGDDYFTAKVVNHDTKKTVATLRIRDIDEDKYADQLYCLGVYYNEALIGVETNYSFTPAKELEKMGYPNLYYRERVDRLNGATSDVVGVNTDRKTKSIMIPLLVQRQREIVMLDPDYNTLNEMMGFVKDANGAYGGMEGTHDDLVMALAIAHFIETQQTGNLMAYETENNDFISKNFNVKKENNNSAKGWINW